MYSNCVLIKHLAYLTYWENYATCPQIGYFDSNTNIIEYTRKISVEIDSPKTFVQISSYLAYNQYIPIEMAHYVIAHDVIH